MRLPSILNGGATQNALATWKYAVATKVLVESTLSHKVVNNDTSFDFFFLKKKNWFNVYNEKYIFEF